MYICYLHITKGDI